jgi:cell division protein ZapE
MFVARPAVFGRAGGGRGTTARPERPPQNPIVERTVLQLKAIAQSLQSMPRGSSLLTDFVPPARFRDKAFAAYRPDPQHRSQAAALTRMQEIASELQRRANGLRARLQKAFGAQRGGGVYLDGGFGVGKTHLLASLWNAAAAPKAYLSFDELVFVSSYMGNAEFRERFLAQRVVCVDEWELDDPGNLTLSLAVLRELLKHGVRVVATSNTLPLDLGEGRFSQKDFKSEIAEMSSAFEVITVRGEDYRHRHFELNPGREYFVDRRELEQQARDAGERALLVPFDELLEVLGMVHPLRYADLTRAADAVFVSDFGRIENLPDALRFVHFIDRLYNSATPLAASSSRALGDLFPREFLGGAYGKKCSRCLSRLEEMLANGAGVEPGPGH